MNDAPIFQSIFAEDWQRLPPAFHKHYAVRPYSADSVLVESKMTIETSPLIRFFAPILRLTGTLVPYAGTDIRATVDLHGEKHSNAFCFDRLFYVPGKLLPFPFFSKMIPVGGAEVVDMTCMGIGWHARYRFDGKKVRMEHRGYKVRWFGKFIPLPLGWLLGSVNAEEEARGDDRFFMSMQMTHPLFGKLYSYCGEFTFIKVALDER